MTGIGYNVVLATKPLIGIEIKWHVLDLLCRRHPIAYAILAAVKTFLAALGDNPDGIKVDFTVKGEISTDIKFQGNTLSGDKKVTAKGDAHITAELEIKIDIIGKIIFGSAVGIAEVGVGGKGEVGLGLEGTLGIDDKGVWMQSSLIFDGFKISFEAVAEMKVSELEIDDDGNIKENKLYSVGGKIEGEITMLANTLTSDKFYLNT